MDQNMKRRGDQRRKKMKERDEQICEACENQRWKHIKQTSVRLISPLMGAPKQLATPTAAATTSISPAALS